MTEIKPVNEEIVVSKEDNNLEEEQTKDSLTPDSDISKTKSSEPQAGSDLSDPETEDKTEQASDVITVMVTGKPKNGKTTALNNIFHLNMETKASAMAVTQEVTIKQQIQRGNTTMQVIDTPGLGSADAPKERITVQMAEATKEKGYTLFYCLSIDPNNMLTEVDRIIVENLTQILDKNVWKKCILLLTFADSACNEFDLVNDYIAFVKEHAQEFQALLKKCGLKKLQVKTIFDYKPDEKLELQEKIADIVAIPVMKLKKANDLNILPQMLTQNQDWTDLVFIELLKEEPEHQRRSFLQFKYDIRILDNYAIRGALLGAAIGQVAGIVGGPLLSILGGGVGTGVGLAVGGAAQLGVTLKNHNKTKESDTKHMELDIKEDQEKKSSDQVTVTMKPSSENGE